MSTQDVSTKISVYAELKPQLATAQAYLKILRNSYKRKCTLNVRRTCLELKWNKKNIHKLDFEDVRFVPTTVHSMQWVSSDQLHFRMQVYDRLASNGHLIHDCDVPKDILQPFRNVVTILCQKCNHILINSQRFKRVLPLPSDNWYEMADSLFCCKHKHTSTPEKHKNCQNESNSLEGSPLSLDPRKEDCLVGETNFIVHGDSIVQKNVKLSDSGILCCSRCQHKVGEATKVSNIVEKESGKTRSELLAVKLFTFSVLVQENENDSTAEILKPPSLSLENELAELIVSHNKKYNSYRIVIECKSNRSVKQYLLIWVLDNKCYQYIGETGESDEMKQCKVTCKQIVKVMYQDCLRKENQSISETWSKDLTVHTIELCEDTCLELINILVTNTQILPQSMRKQEVDGHSFYVGFLTKPEGTSKMDNIEAANTRTD